MQKFGDSHRAQAPIIPKFVIKLLGQPCSSSCWITHYQLFYQKNMTPHRAKDQVFVHNNIRQLLINSHNTIKKKIKTWGIEHYGLNH